MKVLIADPVHPVLQQRLEAHGFECHYKPEISYNETFEVINQYQGLVIRTKFRADKELLRAGNSLHFVARAGAGMDNIDETFASKCGIQLFNAPEGNANAVGEHTLGLLLALMNKIVKSDNEVRRQVWQREENRGFELDGLTVGIIGYGNMGTAFAKKLRGFNVTILAYDKYKTGFSNNNVQEASLNELYEQADVLSLHIPLTDETRNWIDEAFFSNFQKNIWLLNAARGEVVQIEGLIQALESGKVKGAGLDVLPCEKFPLSLKDQAWFEQLSAMDNVVLTPHTAGWSIESFEKISQVLADKIISAYPSA